MSAGYLKFHREHVKPCSAIKLKLVLLKKLISGLKNSYGMQGNAGYSQNNLEKEQSWRTQRFQFQNLYKFIVTKKFGY